MLLRSLSLVVDVGAQEWDLALLVSDLVPLYLVALDLAALERDPNWRR